MLWHIHHHTKVSLTCWRISRNKILILCLGEANFLFKFNFFYHSKHTLELHQPKSWKSSKSPNHLLRFELQRYKYNIRKCVGVCDLRYCTTKRYKELSALFVSEWVSERASDLSRSASWKENPNRQIIFFYFKKESVGASTDISHTNHHHPRLRTCKWHLHYSLAFFGGTLPPTLTGPTCQPHAKNK